MNLDLIKMLKKCQEDKEVNDAIGGQLAPGVGVAHGFVERVGLLLGGGRNGDVDFFGGDVAALSSFFVGGSGLHRQGGDHQ